MEWPPPLPCAEDAHQQAVAEGACETKEWKDPDAKQQVKYARRATNQSEVWDSLLT